MRGGRAWPLFAAVLVLGAASSLRAQAVWGTVTEAGTGAPVEGAFMVLVDTAGTGHGATLTRGDGTYLMTADAPGRYRLHVKRIGFRSVETAAFDVPGRETVRRDVEVSPEAISLEGIRVEGVRRCDLGAEGAGDAGAAALLWEEAREALAVARWAEEIGYRFLVTTFTRPLDLQGRRDESGTRERSGWVGEVFRSLDADSLAAAGYVRRDGDGVTFHGPDAHVLLSGAFRRTHCFRAVREAERVGLAFEPAPDRDLPDVEGTLWFGADGATLEEVEFRYTGLRRGTNHPRAGGTVAFQRLPGGAWMAREWTLRMPVVEEEPGFGGRPEPRVVGFLEQGGRVTDVRVAETAAARPGRGRGVFLAEVPEGWSPEGLARERCGSGRGAAVAGWVQGVSGRTAPGSAVEVRWQDPASPPTRALRVVGDGLGRFVACPLPPGVALRLRLLGSEAGPPVEIGPLAAGAVARVDLRRGGG